MIRGEIYWADLGPPVGRRPVLIATRTSAISVLDRITVIPITRTIRGIDSEVLMGKDEGLPDNCVAACDNVLTVPKSILDRAPSGRLSPAKIPVLDQALRFSLDIRF